MDYLKKIALFLLAVMWMPVSFAQQITISTIGELGRHFELSETEKISYITSSTVKWSIILITFVALFILFSRFCVTKSSKVLCSIVLAILLGDFIIWCWRLLLYTGFGGDIAFIKWIMVNMTLHFSASIICMIVLVKNILTKK